MVDHPENTSRVSARSDEEPTAGEARNGLQMSPDLMLELGRRAVEFVVEWKESLPGKDAWDGEFRQVLEEQLMKDPPEEGRPAEEVLERAARDILPLSFRHEHPRSFAFIPSSPTWPGCSPTSWPPDTTSTSAPGWSRADRARSSWSSSTGCGAGWATRRAPAGCWTSGGSAASFDAFVAARESAGHPERATVYMSDQSHSAHVRAARIIGIRPECIRLLPSDDRFPPGRGRAGASRGRGTATPGFNPIAVCANAGASSTGTIDPLEAMADYCEAEGIWLHVDAAYGGFAVVTEEGKELLRGIERADSIGLDAHKWFFQPYEAGGLLVEGREHAREGVRGSARHPPGNTIMGGQPPELLRPGTAAEPFVSGLEDLDVRADLRDVRVPAGRGAGDGVGGQGRGVRAGERHPGALDARRPWGSCASGSIPRTSTLTRKRWARSTRPVLAHVFWDNPAFVSSTLLHGTFALRLCILNHTTTWDDVRETLEAVEGFGKAAVSA